MFFLTPSFALGHIRLFASGARLLRSLIPVSKMHAFSPTESTPSLLDAAGVPGTAITVISDLNAQKMNAECDVSEIQGDIDALEKERAFGGEILIATHAEQERRVAVVHEAGQAWPEEV